MLDIQWKGKIGYGDIVSPICYAYNLSHKLNLNVNLTFRWEYDSQQKIVDSDPESLWERACFIEQMCYRAKTKVNIIHKFNYPLDINHTNYDWNINKEDIFHNYWFPKFPNKQSSNLIVVNSTIGNKLSLKEYGKDWKDPAAKFWPQIVEKLKSKGYDIVIVDYRTPIKILFNFLSEARGFVGYHGTAAWPARFMHVPSILLADSTLTFTAFPYAVVERKSCKELEKLMYYFDNIENHLNNASKKIETTKKTYKGYMPSKKLLASLVYGKF